MLKMLHERDKSETKQHGAATVLCLSLHWPSMLQKNGQHRRKREQEELAALPYHIIAAFPKLTLCFQKLMPQYVEKQEMCMQGKSGRLKACKLFSCRLEDSPVPLPEFPKLHDDKEKASLARCKTNKSTNVRCMNIYKTAKHYTAFQ